MVSAAKLITKSNSPSSSQKAFSTEPGDTEIFKKHKKTTLIQIRIAIIRIMFYCNNAIYQKKNYIYNYISIIKNIGGIKGDLRKVPHNSSPTKPEIDN